jgi:hypothetical protein
VSLALLTFPSISDNSVWKKIGGEKLNDDQKCNERAPLQMKASVFRASF